MDGQQNCIAAYCESVTNLWKWSEPIANKDKEEKAKNGVDKEEKTKSSEDKEAKDKRESGEDRENKEEGTKSLEINGVKALMQLTVQLVNTVVHEPGIKVS